MQGVLEFAGTIPDIAAAGELWPAPATAHRWELHLVAPSRQHQGRNNGFRSGAQAAGAFYPEYLNFAQNNPIGLLNQNQTHKARAWMSFDVPTFLGTFNISVLERYDSGSHYSLSGSIDIRESANFYGTGRPGGVANPGYLTPPSSVTYFFSDRGEFTFNDLIATDLGINYDSNPSWLRGVRLFIEGEVTNLFDEDAALFHRTSILTHLNDPSLQRFNPFAGDQPVEGVHYRKDPLFGYPTVANHFQTGRTYRVSFGLKF